MHRRSHFGPPATLLALLLTLVSCGGATAVSPAPLTRVTLALGYIPNVQFAPFYVAQTKGFYKDEGIDIAFDNGQSPDLIKAVGAGQFNFAISDADAVIAARSQQIPVDYVAGLYVQFPGAIISLPQAGISQPAQIKGKRVGIPFPGGSSYIGLLAVLNKVGLTEKDIDLQAIGYSQAPELLAGKVDAVIGFANNDALQLRAAGAQPVVLPIGDVVPMVGQGLITNDDSLRTNEKLVGGMVRAMTRGMQYTVLHPDEALQISIAAVPEAGGANTKLNQQVLAATIPLWKDKNTDAQGFGWTDPTAWQAMADTMLRAGIISAAPPVSQAVTNRFIARAAGS